MKAGIFARNGQTMNHLLRAVKLEHVESLLKTCALNKYILHDLPEIRTTPCVKHHIPLVMI